jgi:cation diffusion facilitator CzcD-associated flavoprotein CzcO
MGHPTDVLVVGAGPAGLAVVHELARIGLRPRVVDGAARVAQPWRDRHDMLHLNTHRRARDIVLATGCDRVPVRPRWPGEPEFPGAVQHAADVRRPGDLAGRRVLIVGGGNSGIDLAGALLRVGVARLWVSVRHGVAVVPRRLARCRCTRWGCWRGTLVPLELWDAVPSAQEVAGVDLVELLLQLADDSLLGGGLSADSWARRALTLVDPDDRLRHAGVSARLAR